MKGQKLIIGNWKMNPKTFKEASVLLKETLKAQKETKNVSVGVCVPSVFLQGLLSLKGKGSKFFVGAQNMFYEETGAYTGEISPLHLQSMKVQMTLIGHSERRKLGETDQDCNKKLRAALKRGITPVVCIGETARDGSVWYLSTIKTQLEDIFEGVPKAALKSIVIAYEPVWAIGKDAVREATPEESVEMTIYIRKILSHIYDEKSVHNVRIIYGGSVTTKNAELFLRHGGVDGLLVGRESLSAKSFRTIIHCADTL